MEPSNYADRINELLNYEIDSESSTSLKTVILKGLTQVCKEKPMGEDAIVYLGKWLLENNTSQPKVKE